MSQNQTTTNASAATTAQTKTGEAGGIILEQPYNLSHPSAICGAREGYRPRHKFYEVRREQIRRGVFRSLEKCKHCGGEHSILIDYTVLEGIF